MGSPRWAAPLLALLAACADGDTEAAPAKDARSLVFFPISAVQPTEPGRRAAGGIVRYLDTGDRAGCEEAVAIYDTIIPTENFGGEYTALRWLCAYALAEPAAQPAMRRNREGDRLLRWFEAGRWASLRSYLTMKYALAPGTPAGESDGFKFVDELLRFNSPDRAAWERSDEVMALVGAKPGQTVADIGSGPGFYAFRFAEAVGAAGGVYAVELNRSDLEYMREVAIEESLANLRVVEGTLSGTGLAPDSVDTVFMCATYSAIYALTRGADRAAWVADLRAALRPGGRLVIVENVPDDEMTEPGALPYHGIGVSETLLRPQLEAYGFRVVSAHRFIPQRYALVLEER